MHREIVLTLKHSVHKHMFHIADIDSREEDNQKYNHSYFQSL